MCPSGAHRLVFGSDASKLHWHIPTIEINETSTS
jgi:hypothetical protein